MPRQTKSVVDDKTKEKIITLFRDHGVSCGGLHDRFGISHAKISAILKEAGIDRPMRVSPPRKRDAK